MSRLTLAFVIFAFFGCAAAVFAQDGEGEGAFLHGYVFVSETGSEGCFAERGWIRRIDPVTGEWIVFADFEDGLCDQNGLRFSPDGSRLRVLNLSSNQILDFDANGNATLVYDGSDGLGGPYGGNGLVWNRAGDFYVVSEYSARLQMFPFGGESGIVIADRSDGVYAGGLAVGPDQSVYVGGRALLQIRPDGSISFFDRYRTNRGPYALCPLFDRFGNLLLAVDHSIEPPYGGVIFRYQGTDVASRQLLATGFSAPQFTMDWSPDESILYVADGRNLYEVDPVSGDKRIIFSLPRQTGEGFVRRMGRGIAVYKAPKPGDMNCDNWVNNFDIDPFVLALSDEAGYQAAFGWCDRTRADMNADGAINSFDIDGFVAAIAGNTGD